MKRIFLIIALLLPLLAYSQVNVTLVVPDHQQGELNPQSFRLLKTRLEQLMSKCGVQSGYDATIVMYPVVTILNKEVVGGGMEKLFRYNIELTLNVVQPDAQTAFGAESWNLSGNGFSASKAMVSAINQLSPNDPKFKNFVDMMKQRVSDYYVANRAAIMAKAKSLAAQGQYEEAMGILSAYPQGVSGAKEVNSLLINVYKQYSTANCSQMINQARASFAGQRYDEALAILADVDASSSCASQAKALENQINSRIVTEQRRAEARQERAEQREASLEKARLNAARDIAVAYYKRSQPKITYNSVYVHNSNYHFY